MARKTDILSATPPARSVTPDGRSRSSSRTPPPPPPPRDDDRRRSISPRRSHSPPPPPRAIRDYSSSRSRSRSPPPPPPPPPPASAGRSDRGDRERDAARSESRTSGPKFAVPPATDDRWAPVSATSSRGPPPPPSTRDGRHAGERRGARDDYRGPPPPLPALDLRPRFWGYTLPLPDDDLAPRLIGKSGSVAKHIQSVSGVARIAAGHLPSLSGRGRPIPVLEFRGSIGDIYRAIEGVRQAVLDTRPSSNVVDDIGSRQLDDWCQLEPRHLFLLAGPEESELFKDLRHGLPRDHVPLSVELLNRVDSSALIREPLAAVVSAAARSGIRARTPPPPLPRRDDRAGDDSKRRRVDDDRRNGGNDDRYAPASAPRSRRPPPDSVKDDAFDVEIELPLGSAPAVIGRSGRRMREIHEETRIRCRVKPSESSSQPPMLCMSGPVLQMRAALRIVEEVVQNEVDRKWFAPRIGENGQVEGDDRRRNNGSAKGGRRTPPPPPPPPPARRSRSSSPMRD